MATVSSSAPRGSSGAEIDATPLVRITVASQEEKWEDGGGVGANQASAASNTLEGI